MLVVTACRISLPSDFVGTFGLEVERGLKLWVYGLISKLGCSSRSLDFATGSLPERQETGSTPAIAAICNAIIALSASGKTGHLQGGLGRAEKSHSLPIGSKVHYFRASSIMGPYRGS
jgi:hypothetical protein